MYRLGTLIIALLVVLMSAASASSETKALRLSEPVASDPDAETFGALLDESLPHKQLGELLESPDEWLGRQVRVEARVSQVCQKKGCFFIAKDGDTTLRVSFVDYAFFVPTDIGGKTVTLAGELIQTQLSDAEAE
ncbi:MAG: DUF4920 domain-containing protein, partial [Pseudomonadota bacterium]